MTINEVQDEIIEQFTILEGDRWMTNVYIIELGEKLPPMPIEDKTELNRIHGCLSTVWLTAKMYEGKIYFVSDSNTDTIKGLISLLIRVLNGRTPEEILNAKIYFYEKLGLDRYITGQRGGGLGAMLKQMMIYAFAFKTQQEQEVKS